MKVVGIDQPATTPSDGVGSSWTRQAGSRTRWPGALVAILLLAFGVACSSASPSQSNADPAVVVPTDGPGPGPDGAVPQNGEVDPPRVAVVGDSTAERLAPAVGSWGSETAAIVYVGNASRLGCPMGRGGAMRTAADATGPVHPDCDWETKVITGVDGVERPTFGEVVTGWDPDLVVVYNGLWDVADRELPGSQAWLHAGDPVYDEWLLAELLAANDELSAGGAHVVWLSLSNWEGATRNPPDRLYAPAADPARVVAYNQLLDRVVAARPDSASIVDLAGWLRDTGEDERLRPDGAHFETHTAVEVLERFLGAALLTA